MTWQPDYCTTAELKSHLRISDTADDTVLAIAITAASRAIDQACNRQFGQTTPAAARYYTFSGPTARFSDRLMSDFLADPFRGRESLQIDDLMTTSGLVVKVDRNEDGTYEETLTLDVDYRLFPFNAAADGRPWSRVVLADGETFPTHLRGVEITAQWGWSAVPTTIKQACLLQAARFFQRRNAPFGIAGSPDMGSEMRLLAKVDPDVAVMLSSFVRHWVAV